MSKRNYEEIKNGVPFFLDVEGKKLIRVHDDKEERVNAGEMNFRCCDCGLVHNILVQPGRKKIRVIMQRDNRRTAQTRRWGKFPMAARKRRRP